MYLIGPKLMLKKINIYLAGILFSAVLMVIPAKAATIDIYAQDWLEDTFGSPIDWENLPGTYDTSNGSGDDWLVHYHYIPMSFYIPQGSMAFLTVTWTTHDDNHQNIQELGSWVLTDENGLLIDLVFSILLESYTCIDLEVSHEWLGDGEIIPNPLPPSMVVFMTAMFGVGYLARRRRNKTV